MFQQSTKTKIISFACVVSIGVVGGLTWYLTKRHYDKVIKDLKAKMEEECAEKCPYSPFKIITLYKCKKDSTVETVSSFDYLNEDNLWTVYISANRWFYHVDSNNVGHFSHLIGYQTIDAENNAVIAFANITDDNKFSITKDPRDCAGNPDNACIQDYLTIYNNKNDPNDTFRIYLTEPQSC